MFLLHVHVTPMNLFFIQESRLIVCDYRRQHFANSADCVQHTKQSAALAGCTLCVLATAIQSYAHRGTMFAKETVQKERVLARESD